MALIRCIFLYFHCFFTSLSSKNSREKIAWKSLIQQHSYRLGKKDHKDLLIAIRKLKLALKLLWAKSDSCVIWDVDSTIGIYDASSKTMEQRKSYIEKITREEIKLFLDKEELQIKMPFLSRVLQTIVLFVFADIIFFFSLFYKFRGSLALNILEVTECAHLIRLLKKQNVDKLYYFSAFNKDANFVALALHRRNIYCHKVPSSNPIKNFYGNMITDGFSFTAPFQKNEYEDIKENWFVYQLTEWPVFGFEQIQESINSYREPEKNSLGFISSGIWKRLERGDLALGVGELEAEQNLIDGLERFLQEQQDIKLHIFLHPIEKSDPTDLDKAKLHYSKKFGADRVSFFPENIPTYKLFDQVDTCIAAYSSTNLERLYAGFKTLYAPIGIREDYYSGSAIENIAAFNENALFKLLRETLEMSTSDFFEKNELQAYHHRYYQHLFH